MTFSRTFIASGSIMTVLFVCIILLPSLTSAEIYQWTDANGNTVFTDSPPKGAAAKELKIKPTNQFGPPPQEEENQAPAKSENSTPKLKDLRDISVVLYMTDWCPYCRKAREYLISQGVSFTEYDIDKDKGKREEMRRRSGSTSIPVIDVEGTIIRGFAPEAISSAINSKRRSRN
jgi:glutaredoxin-like YruB-family protein